MSEKLPADANLGSRLYDLLKTCMPGTSPLNDEERKSRLQVCLKCLCYFGRAYNQSGPSELLPSYFSRTLAGPEIIRCIQTEQDPVIRVMGRCFGALVIMKLAAGVKSSTDPTVQFSDKEMGCLSAILGVTSRDVKGWLSLPGAVGLVSMVSLALGDISSLVTNTAPPDVLDVVQQTLNVLSRALSAGETTELQQDQSVAQINISHGEFDSITVSRLHNLLQMCISGTSPLTDEVRSSCLRMCLKSLWCYVKAYHQLGASRPLPPYFPHVLATPEIIRHIQREGDRASRVIGYCFEALVVTKLGADFNSGTVRVGDRELACLTAILGAESHDVKVWLRLPGAIEHMGLFFLALCEVGRIEDTDQSDVLNVVQQTFTILSQTLPAGMNPEPWLDQMRSQVGKFGGKFTTILQYRLNELLEMCTIETPPLAHEARIMCLKSLWYYEIACHHLRALGSLPELDFFPIHFTPEIARRIHAEEDPVARVIGRCFGSLVVNKLAAEAKPLGDCELASLSAILGTENRKANDWLFRPGVAQLVNMVSLTFGEVSSFVTNTVPSDVLHIVGHTIGTLAQALPAELEVKFQLVQADTLMNSSIKSVIVSHLCDLLKTWTLKTLPLPEEVRTSYLQMCLNGLWCWGKVLHQLGVSQPLPPEFLDLAGLEITRHIRTEKDPASRVMGRCFEALVVNNLAALIKSRSNSTVQIRAKARGCLSAILGTESSDVMHWMSQPGAIELVNIVFLALGDIGSLAADTVPSYVLDVVSQTFNILSQALPAEINTELGLVDRIHAPADIPDGQCELILRSCLYGLKMRIRDSTYNGRNIPEPFNQVSEEPVALYTSARSARELGSLAVLRPHCFRQLSNGSSHTHGTGRPCPCDRTLCRGIGRKEACSWRQNKHRLRGSNQR